MQPRPLADSDAACGGKAVALARLIEAELPVPAGFVLDASAFAEAAGRLDAAADELGHALAEAAARIEVYEPPGELAGAVAARAAPLGTLAVRSSATIEDGEAGAAAGVFSSRVAVPPAEVWPAIRAVWASALTPLAASYARRRGAAVAIGVIVQRFVAGERVTVYTRPPGQPRADEAWIQHGERVIKLRRDAGDPAIDLALRAERAIDAPGGADVELVRAADRTWVVQARPIVHPAPRVRTPPPPAVLAPLVADGRRWTWDVAHNPDPLSPAQVGLVEHVERLGVAPWAMRVCAGFLYSAPRAPAAPPAIDSAAELAQQIAHWDRSFAESLDASGPADSVDRALERYAAFYTVWSREIVPAIAAARAALGPDQLAGARPSGVDATLLAAARGELDEAAVIARIGVMAPAWDVAVPTFAEQPALIRSAIARARTGLARHSAPTAAAAAAPPDDAAQLARLGADLAERDDLWFSRAQWLIRRALLARAAALGIAGDDAAWLPLELPSDLDPDDARRRAAAARAAAARAAKWEMPVVVGGAPADAGSPLHGTGTGPRISGRVVRFDSLGDAPLVGPGEVVVVRAVTPALAVIVVGCAALISETGGPLDHGAALARELGIPCVVGCRDAWARLPTGTLVTVDGDRGIVIVDES
jgi:phosphohistidine swiveling domain-containing protein